MSKFLFRLLLIVALPFMIVLFPLFWFLAGRPMPIHLDFWEGLKVWGRGFKRGGIE